MNNSVVIKGSKHGIVVVLDENMTYDEILDQVRDKFTSSSKFFGKANMALAFEGQTLSLEQKQQIVDIISEVSELNIICLVEDDQGQDVRFKNAIEKAINEDGGIFAEQYRINHNIDGDDMLDKQNAGVNNEILPMSSGSVMDNTSAGQFYKGTLRSGQIFESDSSIIILGDVNPGGKVVAKGNVIILGSLKGNVFAGASGNENSFVVALNMDPMQIKIGDVIARSADSTPRKKDKGIQPKIAFVEDGSIYIENLEQSVLEDIRLN